LLANTLLAQSDRLLHTSWRVRESTEQTWLPATVPGAIHTDLMRAGIIQDPFFGTNEKNVQWVGERTWIYETTFALSEYEMRAPQIALVFEGLDTYATIEVNGKVMMQTNNMFRTYRLPLMGIAQRENRLRIVFEPAEKIANQLAEEAKPLVRPCENNRHYVRKAQYHFGWDWAPHLLTCGIWRPIKLSFTLPTEMPPSKRAPVQFHQVKDSIGQSFYFTVNGRPTYMKGANWVPADVFLHRVTKDRYRQLLVQAKQMGMNMLRVWGGGVYESDDFYSLCDSLGIWVWQDFMFAGAMYPASNTDFRENVIAEVRDNVLRLRKHPCIVLWCGNNEIDEAWRNWGWQKQHSISSADSIFLWNEYQTLFHETIPALLNELDPGRPYIASSPLHGWGRDISMREGDSHYWGVWWGKMPKGVFKQKVPRFMSEFGMQAMPSKETAKQFGLETHYSINDVGLRQHQKHPTGYETIETYLRQTNWYRSDFTWDTYIEATQRMQSDVILEAVRAQQSSKGRCMGSLIWQLNDCWPVCSWSLIDYYGRPKQAVSDLKSIWNP
jgi:beta-mannosidase